MPPEPPKPNAEAPLTKAGVGPGGATGRTLPPRWGASGALSVSQIALEQQRPNAPVARRKGPHAELATFEAQLRRATAKGDVAAERQASSALSRALAARGAELDTVTKLARRSLVLGEDVALRTELSTWFAGLGEPALAAATLRPIVSQRSGLALSRVLTRIAVLLARGADARGAAEALTQAGEHADADPLPPELLGAVGAWAPDAVAPERAALAYVEGSKRRERSGEKASAFEDLLRAFEMAPQCTEAATALARALSERNRAGAADEVMREHARALLDEQAESVHIDRMRAAAAAGELHRALAAGLDAHLESRFSIDAALSEEGAQSADGNATFEKLLDEAGLHDLLAARLDVAADSLEGEQRARARVMVGRWYQARLNRSQRATAAFMDAMVADPSLDDGRSALRNHAEQTLDYAPLVEGLLRVGLRAPDAEGFRECMEELLHLAEERLADPGLAEWAARRLLEKFEGHQEALQALERLAPRVRLQNEALRAARGSLEGHEGEGQGAALTRLAAILMGRPSDADEYVDVLKKLLELDPTQSRPRQQLRLVLERMERYDELDALLKSQEEAAQSPEKEALVLERARLARARGHQRRALKRLRRLMSVSSTHAELSAVTLVLATRLEDVRARAWALSSMAASLNPPLKATLLSVAAEELLTVGDRERAKELAEHACHADPSRTRPVAARAMVVAASDEVDHAALERAVGVVVPRTAICAALADSYERQGEPLLALAWTQRHLALRPGDLNIARVLLGRVVAAEDPSRLGDALAWLLSQPEPLVELEEPISAALLKLAELAPDRSGALVRRALDVLGPRKTVLRETIIKVADMVNEKGLAIAVIERWLASGAPGELRAEALLDVARRRKEAGDADGAARALLRSMREGGSPEQILAILDDSLQPRGSDGILAMLEARAEALSAVARDDLGALAVAWREVGAARWDLAADHEGAYEAWERAAALHPEEGYNKMAADLLEFAGAEAALARLEKLAASRSEPSEAARVLAVASNVALEAGRLRDALTIGARSLELDPSRPDVLAVVERSARPEDIAALDEVYAGLAQAALGQYGVRAAHYRAARQMEQRNQPERALNHALRAFEAVPSEGAAYVMMARLVQNTGNPEEVVRTLERVAQQSPTDTLRTEWLRRAAMFAGPSASGVRQRLEVLLRALALRADPETLQALGEAFRAALAAAPEDREILQVRLERALKSVGDRAVGRSGALLCLLGARVALDEFSLASAAHRLLAQGIGCDPSLPQYRDLLSRVNLLAEDREASAEVVKLTLGALDHEFAPPSRGLCELAAELAQQLDDEASAAKVLVFAAQNDPDDTDLVRRAEVAAHRIGDRDMLEKVLEAVPIKERVLGLVEIADRCQHEGQVGAAIDALKRALEVRGIDATDRVSIRRSLADLYRAAGHRAELEELLTQRLESEELSETERAGLSAELAALIAAGGDPERALRILAPIARASGEVGLLGDMATFARQAGDRRAHAEALDLLVEREKEAGTRLELLRELAGLLQEIGDEDTSLARYKEVLALSPNDPQALGALERDAEARGDYETLVDILARRAAQAPRVDEVRRIHLHRAVVLEHRLAQPEEARNELEALLAATGDNLSVLRVLADLNERLGDPARAAGLWLRASAIAEDKAEAEQLAYKSCEAQLSAGDVEAARRVLDGVQAWARSNKLLELRVEVERRSENPTSLGQALEEQAAVSSDTPERRASIFVEAARAALAAGDEAAAMRRLEQATRVAPHHADAQLEAQRLKYLRQGPGSKEQARITVAELRGVKGELNDEQRELQGFLLVEALEVALGGLASAKELDQVLGAVGPRPLLAAALGERAHAAQDWDRALSFFERAVQGDLRGLKSRAELALLAAESAHALGQSERAKAFLEIASADAAVKPRAERLQSEVNRSNEPSSEVPTRRSTTPPKGVQQRYSHRPGEIEVAEHPRRPHATTMRSEPPLADAVPDSSPQVIVPGEIPDSDAPDSPLEGMPMKAVSPGYELSGVTYRPSLAEMPAVSETEADLLGRLRRGDEGAGFELIGQLENKSDRTQDLVSVCRRLAKLKPGDPWTLNKLHEAAALDLNHAYARAVEHVLGNFDATRDPVAPPPLRDQPEHPEAVRMMLTRDATTPATTSLGLVWSGASHVFRRDPATYGVTGLERIPLGAPTPLARAYSDAARAMGMTRTPLFQRRSGGNITISMALLVPPALILTGEVQRATTALRYHLGAMLAGAWPEHVLLLGAEESQARAILGALVMAFGPPQQARSTPDVARLAEVLWQSIPARSQRQLRELCDDVESLEYPRALAAARKVFRRAALFVSADLGFCLRQLIAEEQLNVAMPQTLEELRELCKRHPGAADLVRLATSPEFAEVRWQTRTSRSVPP